MNKRDYEKRRAELVNVLEGYNRRLALLERIVNSDPAGYCPGFLEAGELWDDIYHGARKIEEKIHDLDWRWSVRDWDCQDWTLYNLACKNID